MRARVVVVAAAAIAVAVAPPEARAYRTTQDEASLAAMGMTGRIAWTASPVPYWINEAGSDDLTLAELTPAVDTSFATWTQPPCSGLAVQDMGTTATRAVARDGVDVVVWEESHWSDMGFPTSLVGITFAETTLTDGAWTITGADTHLNGVDYTWVIEGGHTGSTTIDVQSIVTHEAGHFLGLLHPCEVTGFDGAPVCAPLTDPASAPTMFPAYTGETERTLEADDIAGICFLYPLPDAGVVDGGPPDGGGSDGGSPDAGMGGGGGCCAAAGTRASGSSGLALLGLLPFLRRRGSRRER